MLILCEIVNVYLQNVSVWKLALVVLVLVMVDLVILVEYTAVEGARGNLEAERVENKENSQDVEGVSSISILHIAYNIGSCFLLSIYFYFCSILRIKHPWAVFLILRSLQYMIVWIPNN